jgi:adenosylhomocysteine nucleosidase
MTVAVVTAMPSEMRPFRNRLPDGVVTAITGIGTARATKATTELLDRHPDVDRVVMVGVAGGLRGTSIGDVVVPETVIDHGSGRELHPEPIGNNRAKGTILTTDQLLVDPSVVADLEARGVNALDMETAAVGAVCEARGVAWSAFRAISDRSTDGLIDDQVFKMAKPDGSPDLLAVARYVLPRPWKIAGLVKLGRDLSTATKAAAEATLRALTDYPE